MHRSSDQSRKRSLLIAFWSVVFLVNLGPEWQRYSSIREGVEVAGLATVLQWFVALVALKLLLPRLLDKNRKLAFVVSIIATMFLASEIYILVSYLYLESNYPDTYGAFYLANLADLSIWQRLGLSGMIKYIILGKWPMLLFPSALLISVSFYERQKHILELREQKQVAELRALKGQLNPHFIFNTLNNIYALALCRSEQTATAVERLSGILDYVLHNAHDKSVLLDKEIQMINDYIALEKLRFGDRVNVSFKHNVDGLTAVAPLLFLTLVENAFKHGVSQELKQSKIDIILNADREKVCFSISNSKPKVFKSTESSPSIGLKNMMKQLELLYPVRHSLQIQETENNYSVDLTIQWDDGSR
ncbi:histidine kinase [uncultured Pseudoteredinibacter sp.]|uniref:sensor histidine kinase n=1 Tax=uncultured Pseudoteredinibacter sp. TaxID=1641701 RepID=UPI002611049B|nr:histidine kinase [uncultured Pseudoteredinibacter sp.]